MFMNSIIDIADNLITDVADNLEFENVKFIKAYGINEFNPSQEGFTAVVNIDNIERGTTYISGLYDTDTLGEVFSAGLVIRLYGGEFTSGESLTRMACNLREAVISADSDGFIDKSAISSIKYENNSASVYREIRFDIEYVLCEAIV